MGVVVLYEWNISPPVESSEWVSEIYDDANPPPPPQAAAPAEEEEGGGLLQQPRREGITADRHS